MTQSRDICCPECGSVIRLEDINVAADIFLCAFCRKAGNFSDLARTNEDRAVLEEVPKRWQVGKTARGVDLYYKKPWWTGIFHLIFALGWNGFLVVFTSILITKIDVPFWFFLFLVPFILVGVGVAWSAIYTLFGGMKITLESGRGSLFKGIGYVGKKWDFVIENREDITEDEEWHQDEDENPGVKKIFIRQPNGKTFKFGSDLVSQEDQQFLTSILRNMASSARV